MIDEDEMQDFYEEGDNLIKSYHNYSKRMKDLVIDNPKIKQKIDTTLEIIGHNKVMLSRTLESKNQLKDEILSQTNQPHLQQIDVIRKLGQLFKLDEDEYISRVTVEAKLNELSYFIARECEVVNPEKEQKIEKKVATQKEKETIKEEKLNKFSELIDDYMVLKGNYDIDKKRVRLMRIKNQIKEIGQDEWIKDEFEKITGDVL